MKELLLNTMNQQQLRLIKQLSLRKESIKNTAYKLGYSVRYTRRKLKNIKRLEQKFLFIKIPIKYL